MLFLFSCQGQNKEDKKNIKKDNENSKAEISKKITSTKNLITEDETVKFIIIANFRLY